MKTYLVKFILLIVSSLCWAGPSYGGDLRINPEDISKIEVNGILGLLLVADFDIEESGHVEYCSMKLGLTIEGIVDPDLQSFLISCVPWFEEYSESENFANANGSYWITGSGEVSIDVTSCVEVSGSKATLRCLLGDFSSRAQILNLGVDFSKSIDGSIVQILTSSGGGPFSLGSYSNPQSPRAGRGRIASRPEVPRPKEYSLVSAPNPFNPSTTISFEGGDGMVKGKIGIYNVRGQRIFQMPVEFSGRGSFVWKGLDQKGLAVGSGVYFVLLSSEMGEKLASLSIVLLK